MDVIVDGYIYYGQKVGGISRIFDEVLSRLCSLDPSISVKLLIHSCKPDLNEKIEQIIIPNLEKYFRPPSLWRNFYPILNNLLVNQRVGQTKNKIFHSTYYRSLGNWQGKQVCSVYDMIYEKYPNMFTDANEVIYSKAQAFKRADQLVCISNTTKADLIYYYNIPEEKISVSLLSYGEQFRQIEADQISFQMRTPFILYVGGRSKYKGFSDLANAYSQWSRHYDLNLVVVGNEWTKQELDLLCEIGIKDRVLLFDKINDRQLCDFYNQAVVFVYPSHYEGFGIPLLEAMACGCPVIASDIPSTREVAGNIPFYFKTAEPGSLEAALNRCSDNNGRDAAGQVKMGLEWVKQYSWQKTAQAFID